MRVLVFDPSNRAPLYLAEFVVALSRLVDTIVIAPRRQEEEELKSGIPSQLRPWHARDDGHGLRRFASYLRAWMAALSMAQAVDVKHIQWLAGLDRGVPDLWLVRGLLRRYMRVAYTVHKMVPHGLRESESVTRRYAILYRMVPLLFVHAERTKWELAHEFHVPSRKIVVIRHGPLLQSLGTAAARFIRWLNPCSSVPTHRSSLV